MGLVKTRLHTLLLLFGQVHAVLHGADLARHVLLVGREAVAHLLQLLAPDLVQELGLAIQAIQVVDVEVLLLLLLLLGLQLLQLRLVQLIQVDQRRLLRLFGGLVWQLLSVARVGELLDQRWVIAIKNNSITKKIIQLLNKTLPIISILNN